jgi:hypothetical protein
MASLWWALGALVSPMLVNLVLAASGGAPDTWRQDTAFLWTLFGALVSGFAFLAVTWPRMQGSPVQRVVSGVVVFGFSTLAASVLSFYGCALGGMYSAPHDSPTAPVLRSH